MWNVVKVSWGIVGAMVDNSASLMIPNENEARRMDRESVRALTIPDERRRAAGVAAWKYRAAKNRQNAGYDRAVKGAMN